MISSAHLSTDDADFRPMFCLNSSRLSAGGIGGGHKARPDGVASNALKDVGATLVVALHALKVMH